MCHQRHNINTDFCKSQPGGEKVELWYESMCIDIEWWNETSVFLNFQEEQTSKEESGTLDCNVFGTIQHKAVENNT